MGNMENGILANCWIAFTENIWRRDFQNGGAIALLHRAQVEFNFDGLKLQKARFS